MFRILVLDKRDSIHAIIKYLLYRYQLVFSRDLKDAVDKLGQNNIDMLLINLPLENGSDSLLDKLKDWAGKKKIIALADMVNPDLVKESRNLGVLECIDKFDISILPELVDKHLNKSDTRILDIKI